MRNSYKITLSVLTIMILITITIGTSYSYYSIAAEQTNPNEISTSCFNITFSENTNSFISLNSDNRYAYPMSEATALSKLTPYEFTIENTCTTANSSIDTKYVVLLSTLTTTTSNLTGYINYKINQTLPTTITGTTKLLTTETYNNLPAEIITANNLDTNYILETGTLEPGASKTFNLYLWIKDDADNTVMSKNFTGKILVYSYM